MSIEVRSKLKGKVTGIKKFGAFVELPEGKGGLAHISEVANSYVENAEDHLSVGDRVGVRVLSIVEDGEISPPIRKAKDRPRHLHHGSSQNKSPQQKAEDSERKLSNFLKDGEDKLTSIKHQTEPKRGGKGFRR